MSVAFLPSGPLILASASSTRRQLLVNAGIDFVSHPVNLDEATIRASCASDGIPPGEMAIILAEMKAQAAAIRADAGEGQLILGADQILLANEVIEAGRAPSAGKIYSKPASRVDAAAQLKALSGKRHQVLTAMVIFRNGSRIWHHLETADLEMRTLSDAQIEVYLEVIGDAAFSSPASYQIEGAGVHLFSRIKGCHFGILGLPMLALTGFLKEHGLYLKSPASGNEPINESGGT